MKKTLFLLILPLLLFSCGKKTNFSLSGQLNGGAGKTIYLSKLLPSSQQLMDSAKINSEGKFKFKGRTSSPTYYLLTTSENNFVTLLIDSTENSIITGNYKGFATNYKVHGSVGSQIIRGLNIHYTTAKNQLDSLNALYNAHTNDPAYSLKLAEWKAQGKGIMADHSSYLTEFVKKNPFSLACIYAMYQKWDEKNFVINDLQTMKIVASALYSIYPKNEQVVSMYQNTLEIIKNESNKKFQSFISENAVNSPNIILPDADGKNKELWSFHGKYVLLHFWSAKDQTSRTMNPVLAEIYSKYKKRGLEIYMVCVDKDRAAWMEAIQEDNLNCINVGDMKGCFQAVTNYNIHEVPSNYLLDKDGKIIAKDLKGPAINQILGQIFK